MTDGHFSATIITDQRSFRRVNYEKAREAIGKFVVKHRILIVIASILLCIPSLFGYINTDINYDILVYLPEDIDTMKGQDILAEDFDMGSFAMCVVENMSSKDVLDLEEKYKDIEELSKLYQPTI